MSDKNNSLKIEEKESAIKAAVFALRKKFGQTYVGFGSEILSTDYKRNSTGIYALDYLCGGSKNGWGLPERKIIMLAGKEGAGKTASCLRIIAEYQRNNKVCALLNVEFGFDAVWATKIGVQLDKLHIFRPVTIEQASDTIEPLLMSGGFDLIVLDSIASLSSNAELQESAEKQVRSGNAKANGKMVRKINAVLNDSRNEGVTSVLIINQIREKQNVMFGNPEYTPGGHALHHAADITLWLKPGSFTKVIGGKENPLGIPITAYCSKNRTSQPFRTSVYNIMFSGVIDDTEQLLKLAVAYNVVEKTGYRYTYKDKSISDEKNILALLGGQGSLSKTDLKLVHNQIEKVLSLFLKPKGFLYEEGGRYYSASALCNIDNFLGEKEGEIVAVIPSWTVDNVKKLLERLSIIMRNDWPVIKEQLFQKVSEGVCTAESDPLDEEITYSE